MIVVVSLGLAAYEVIAFLTHRRKISRARGLWRVGVFAWLAWLFAHLVIEAAIEDREERAAQLVAAAWNWN